jgi:copper(I)-binding protein
MGTLVITVTDASGSPQASASVQAARMVNTGKRCPSLVQGETDSTGVVRFERLKPGPYDIMIIGLEQPTTKTQIEDGKTTSVTLNMRP